MAKDVKFQGFVLLLLSALSWAPAYLFIKLVVEDIPPITLAFLRVAIASILLYPICIFQKESLRKWKHLIPHFAVMGITLNVIPFCLISSGEQYISSSLAGVLVSLALIITVVLAHFFGRHEALTRTKIYGICAGVIGLCFIYLPLISQESINDQLGVWMVVLASCSIGVGTVYARKHLQAVPALVALTLQLLISTIILLPLALIFDQPYDLPHPSLSSILGIVALAVVSTVLAYYFYYKNIQLSGATYASLSLLLIPIFAVILGAVFLHERFTWNFYLGALFILAGVGAINPLFSRKRG